MEKYIVKKGRILNNGIYYLPGDVIELDEKTAKAVASEIASIDDEFIPEKTVTVEKKKRKRSII